MTDTTIPNMPDQALALLHRIIVVEDWIRAGDDRGQPYLDAGAARVVGDRVEFCPEIFERVEMVNGQAGAN